MTPRSEPVVWILVHDLDRSGVPIVLERLLRATAQSAHVHVIALRGGPVRTRIQPLVASCTVIEPTARRSAANAFAVGARELHLPWVGRTTERLTWSARLHGLPSPDVAVIHGAGAWSLVDALRGDPPLVLHLHELELGLDRSIPRAAQSDVLRKVSAVLAVSRPVADLALRRGADSSKVELVPGVVETPTEVKLPGATSQDKNGVLVMGAGRPGWRKATDRVTAIAHELTRRGFPGVVGWVGGRPSGPDSRWISAHDPVHWYPEADQPWSTMADADVIVVPSREDPLPLVALEAGLHSKAVVATPTGGLVDLLAQGRGAIAPGHDIRWLVETVERLLIHRDEREELGAALRARVLAQHDAAIVAPQWWSAIRQASG